MESPWSRRLRDLRQLIEAAHETYFEPDRFRLNLNNAIQTSRTVTFLIQKGKGKISDYERLYKSYILDATSSDPIMQWLKDSRNVIEKEGDLETYSEMRAEVIFSYTDDGPSLDARDEHLLFASSRILQKFWAKRTPRGISGESAIQIERRWVANTLPNHELTDALIHGYKVLEKAARAMDAASGYASTNRKPNSLRELGSAMRKTFIKMSDGRQYGMSSVEPRLDRPTPDQLARYGGFDAQFMKPGLTLRERMECWADMATRIFNADGGHTSIYILLDRNGDFLTLGFFHPRDHTEKLVFWRLLGDLAQSDANIAGVIFVSEAWLRQADVAGWQGGIGELPIIGETLAMYGANAAGEAYEISFIVDMSSGKPQIDRTKVMPRMEDAVPNFFAPLQRAWDALKA